jgi:hypothetical protein
VAQPILKKEPNILKIKQDEDQLVHVVGDLHGAFTEGVARYFQQQGFPGAKNKFNPDKFNVYVFNGDFVDRGTEDVEVMVTLLFWKILEPDHVFLIRGNHETEKISARYGFKDRVDARFPGKNAHKKFVEKAFKHMPVGAVLDDQVFIVHGGIGEHDNRDSWTIKDLDGVDRSQEENFQRGQSLSTLIWSDPGTETGDDPWNRRGPTFGRETAERFLEKNNLKLIVRAHEHLSSLHSMQSHHHRLVYTIHSAPDYAGNPSNASYWTFSKNDFGFGELRPPSKGTYATFDPKGPLGLKKCEQFWSPEDSRDPSSYAAYISKCDKLLGLTAGEYIAGNLPYIKGTKSLFVRVTINRPLYSRYNPDPKYFFNNSGELFKNTLPHKELTKALPRKE